MDRELKRALDARFAKTLKFVQKHIPENSKILDLGTPNDFAAIMKESGYQVTNTQGENLDIDYQKYIDTDAEFITSFEIFEHMLAPFNILREINTNKMVVSVPLKLWFAEAYWNDSNDWDKHYHEFEKKQFDFLLEQTGWVIKDFEIWKSYDRNIGIRPFLRRITPRYYIVYCEKPIKAAK